MRTVFSFLASFLFVSISSANSVKPATLSLDCWSHEGLKKIVVISSAEGSSVSIDGDELYYSSGRINASARGTVEIENARHSLRVEGADLTEAFNKNRMFIEGKTNFVYQAPDAQPVEGFCTGFMSF